MTQQSGIQGWSSLEASRSYVIFSVVNVDAFEALSACRGFKRLEGCYKGARERSYIATAKDYKKWFVGWVRGQESVLVLGPMVSHPTHLRDRAARPACLHFLDGKTLPVPLGHFLAVPAAEALARDAWTLDPATVQYYTCE